MTKHEFRMALLLLALFTAGTLGYQSLNADRGGHSADCTLAKYFSSFSGCNSSENIIQVSHSVFVNRIEDYFSNKKPELFNLRLEVDHRAAKNVFDQSLNPDDKDSTRNRYGPETVDHSSGN